MMGGRKNTVSDEEILKFVAGANMPSNPIVTTTEVANHFEFSNQGMTPRLESLEEDGLIRRKRAGQTDVWWLSEKGEKCIQED